MSAARSSWLKDLTRSDVALAVGGVLGLVAYLMLLPAVHPDATVSYRLGPEGAVEAARTYLRTSGFTTDELEAEAVLERVPSLIEGAQEAGGRAATMEALEAGRLLAYRWQVRFAWPDQHEEEDAFVYELYLTPEGKVWSMNNRALREGPAGPRRVQRNALEHVFLRGEEGELPSALPAARTDSALTAMLYFVETDSVWRAQAPVGNAGFADVGRVLADTLAQRYRIGFGPQEAIALARFHLNRTPLVEFGLQPDSTWLAMRDGVPSARVRFRGEQVLGQRLEAVVEVQPTGGLGELEADAKRADVNRDEGPLSADMAQGLVLVLLILLLLVTFFRRLMNRLIDVRGGLIDGAVFGGMLAILMALANDFVFTDADVSFWTRLLVGMLIISVVSSAAALFGFMAASVADSMTRATWSRKLFAASLVRQGLVRNSYVGAALLRGVGLGFVLLGLYVTYLYVLPGSLAATEGQMLVDQSIQPMTWAAMASGLYAFGVTVLLLLFVGTFLYRRRRSAWMAVAGVAVVAAVLHIGPGTAPEAYGLVLSALTGLTLALVFVRFDFLASFTGLFVAHLFWMLSEGWLVAGSPVGQDLMFGTFFLLFLVGLGVVGLLSGHSARETREYVPTYIKEMAQEERLQRELEIAHQVQESFLPRQMPRIEGVDLAAMCLAAQEVGGDYYDFVKLDDDRLAVVVGDVSGKGIPAAFYMTLVKGFLLTLCRDVPSPAEVLRRINTLFCEQATRGIFISMIYGVFDLRERTFTFARAGHNPVILKRSPSQQADMMQPPGMAIGLTTGPRFDRTIEEVTVHLRAGDVLVFYTDGFSEAMNTAKDQYGDDRLAQKVGDVGQRSAGGILRAVTEDVHHFIEAAGRHDDMTMVVLKVAPPTQPAVREDGHRAETKALA